MALKAGNVQNPPPGAEGDLYREFKRTQPAPQGICVANSSGKVLAWSLMFDDEASVIGFLDHTRERYEEFPNAETPTASERFMRFPSSKLDDIADNGMVPRIPESHGEGETCPGQLQISEGSLQGRVIGRVMNSDGLPLSNARTQDNYIEDRFEITLSMQENLQTTLKASGKGTDFRLPQDLARALVASAHLGQLDVAPLGGAMIRARTTIEEIQLWAHATTANEIQIWGKSDIGGQQDEVHQRPDDGRVWDHRISLDWNGKITVDDDGRITGMALSADGTEKLRWNHEQMRNDRSSDLSRLPGGRPIDFDGPVQYGVIVD